MQFNVITGEAEGRTRLVAVPGDYDAHPLLAEVEVAAVAFNQHPDRMAVALCLMFHPWISGVFHLSGQGCSPNVATAIREFIAPTEVHVFPVNCVPQRKVTGEQGVVVEADELGLSHNGASAAGRICIKGMDASVGMLASNGNMTVSTNATLLQVGVEDPLSRILPALSVAVLFCEDLMAGRLLLPATLLAQGDRDRSLRVERIRKLLDSCAIQLAWI